MIQCHLRMVCLLYFDILFDVLSITVIEPKRRHPSPDVATQLDKEPNRRHLSPKAAPPNSKETLPTKGSCNVNYCLTLLTFRSFTEHRQVSPRNPNLGSWREARFGPSEAAFAAWPWGRAKVVSEGYGSKQKFARELRESQKTSSASSGLRFICFIKAQR